MCLLLNVFLYKRYKSYFLNGRSFVVNMWLKPNGRQVIVDQRIGVDEFDSAGWAVQLSRGDAECFARRVYQEWPDALAVAQRGVAHGRVQFRGWALRWRQQLFQCRIDTFSGVP